MAGRGWCFVVAVVLAVVVGAMPRSAEAVVQKAESSDLFVDSVCVNTHFRFAGTSWVANRTRLIELLAESGVLNVRDDSAEVASLLAAHGIKMNYGVFELPWNQNSNITATRKVIQQMKDAINGGMLIDAIMGPNEPDGMWPPKNITYNGQGFPNGTMDYMRDLYTLLRQDSFFKDKWIIGAPLAVTDVFKTNMSRWVDFGDFHPYPFDGNYLAVTFVPYANVSRYFYYTSQPSTNLDQYPEIWNKAKAYYPDRPWFATETGYSTERGGVGTSIRAQALYMNRIFTEYFRLGIRRTCVYAFLDDHDNPTDHESNFGLLFANYTAKPSYTALKNLMALVRSDWAPSASQLRPPTYALKSLNFTLNVSAVGSYDRTDYVHHLLLQKPDGTLLLLVWHEITDEDTKQPRRQIYPPRMPTELTLPPRYNVRVYAPNDGPGLSAAYTADGESTYSKASRISLSVPDHVLVLELKEADMSSAAGLSSWLSAVAANCWLW